ncbi:MAG: aminopeptidase N [Tahibacter sp.]
MNATSPIESAATARVHLADYREPDWRIETVELEFDLDPLDTRVLARLQLRRSGHAIGPLRLDGEGLELLAIRLDGVALGDSDYRLEANGLVVFDARDGSLLETQTRLEPLHNTALSGLYTSKGGSGAVLLTQCEAQGFRRITWFPDRPDVLSRYRVTLRADRQRFPLLLSNGNLLTRGETGDGRHWATWQDPHPKPCYLFALVAGDLATLDDEFVTVEGRRVALRIHANAELIGRCAYAMDALKRAMRWDEVNYGRCYDLDIFQIVATDDFNMGAMENKGLNIFNSKYLLVDPAHSSDEDFRHVEAIVAHEYFHNWTGNRVTCRDWFQLALKEGLTVYREQQFSADSGSVVLKRIEDVQILRRAQFTEDAGPLAHAVRPDSYAAIDNFYTATVYDKGAELIRMLAARLGRAGWRAGMDEYFHRHDGQAATVEQFLAALGGANDLDLSGYLVWYAQAGTPVLSATGQYDAQSKTYTLSLKQSTAPTPGQPIKHSLPIPVRIALLGDNGLPLPLRLADSGAETSDESVLELQQESQSWRFLDIPAAPRAVSLLRGCSAPVRLSTQASATELAFLLSHESDGFNRWEAAQQLARLAFDEQLERLATQPMVKSKSPDRPADSPSAIWCDALASLIGDVTLDPALLAELLSPPDELELAERCTPYDPTLAWMAREALENSLAHALGAATLTRHADLLRQEQGAIDGAAQNRRRLLNRCLALAARREPARVFAIAAQRSVDAPSMSERQAALGVLTRHAAPQADAALASFEQAHATDAVTLDKWFALQARIPSEDTVERVEALLAHPAFSLRNPNRVHALLGTFAIRSPLAFHRADGAGYALFERALIELDGLNPQVAARMATAVRDFRRLEPGRRGRLQAMLRRLQDLPDCSRDLADILRRALDEA